jgi:hypothetical protein
MDRLPPHLWYSVLQLTPTISLAWANASKDTQLVFRATHHGSLTRLVTCLSLQFLCPGHPRWQPGRVLSDAALTREHQKNVCRELVRRGDLSACRWLVTLDWWDILREAVESGQLACAAWAKKNPGINLDDERCDFTWLPTKAARHGHVHLCEWLSGLMDLKKVSLVMSEEAAMGGHLPVLQWLVAHNLMTFPAVNTLGLMIFAAFSNHVHICQWLHQNAQLEATWEDEAMPTTWSTELGTLPMRQIFVGAVRRGLLDVCQWLHSTYCIPTHVVTHGCCDVLRVACDVDQTRVCKNWELCRWLYETFVCVVTTPQEHRSMGKYLTYTRARQKANQLSPIEFVNMAFPAMVNAGCIQGVMWLQETFSKGANREWPHWEDLHVVAIGQGAIDSGNVILCLWLGVDTITHTGARLKRAVEKGHLGILKWLHQKIPRIPWHNYLDDLFLEAAKHGRLATFDWLLQHGLDGRVAAQALSMAMEHGHLTMCQRVMQHFFAPHTNLEPARLQTGLLQATCHGHLDVCQWLAQCGVRLSSADMAQRDVYAKNLATWQWALDTF